MHGMVSSKFREGRYQKETGEDFCLVCRPAEMFISCWTIHAAGAQNKHFPSASDTFFFFGFGDGVTAALRIYIVFSLN